jgi:MoaA/NifB/PqqE/SkfB family radical SAM enzyme
MGKNKKEQRPLRALQIEVTSRCTRHCSICPRTSLSENWQDGDLSESLWEVLEPDLGLAEHVHLQGWGEPLLNPNLPRWAARAREAGCSVGITTNGDLLAKNREWLLEGNVNLITFSAAGSGERHSTLRDGARLDRVLREAAELVSQAKKRKLGIVFKLSYLLTCSNAHELSEAVKMAAQAGFSEVFLTHLDCPTSRHQQEESAYQRQEMLFDAGPVLKEAAKIARRSKIAFREPTLSGEDVLACALNPINFTFVTWDGRVGPCVNLLLPVRGAIPRFSESDVTNVKPLAYGRLDEAPLSQILQSRERELFVTPLQKRLDAEDKFRQRMNMEICELRILRGLEEAQSEREDVLRAYPLPEPCVACPKSSGW